jgi:hypothetical protein
MDLAAFMAANRMPPVSSSGHETGLYSRRFGRIDDKRDTAAIGEG